MVCCLAAIAILSILSRVFAQPISWARGGGRDVRELPTARYAVGPLERSDVLR